MIDRRLYTYANDKLLSNRQIVDNTMIRFVFFLFLISFFLLLFLFLLRVHVVSHAWCIFTWIVRCGVYVCACVRLCVY